MTVSLIRSITPKSPSLCVSSRRRYCGRLLKACTSRLPVHCSSTISELFEGCLRNVWKSLVMCEQTIVWQMFVGSIFCKLSVDRLRCCFRGVCELVLGGYIWAVCVAFLDCVLSVWHNKPSKTWKGRSQVVKYCELMCSQGRTSNIFYTKENKFSSNSLVINQKKKNSIAGGRTYLTLLYKYDQVFWVLI